MSIVETVTSYAQNREDIIIDAFLKHIKQGFYIDVGAGHPLEHSVTKLFYEKGWKGINIEPEPKMFKLLKQERPRDVNIKAGLSDKSGSLTMRQYLGWRVGLSTFSKDMMEEHSDIEDYMDVETKVTTLREIFEKYKPPHVDFMKIDVEGYEFSVLKGNDWKKYRPTLICIETNHVKKNWASLLKQANYSEVFFDGLNKYYVADEAKDIIDDFSYAEDVASKTIINYRSVVQIEKLKKHTEQLVGDLSSMKTENLRLQREIIDQKRLVSLVKQLAKSSDTAVRARLERLNKPKGAARAKHEIELDGVKDRDELFKQIRLSDLKNYYTNTYRKDRFHYRVLAGGYDSLSRLGFKLGKAGLGAIRKAKHGRSK